MKNIKKIFTAALLTMAAFGFFGCAMDSEDENLTVDIAVSKKTNSSATVTLTPSYNVTGIIYTTDGTEPSARYDSNSESKVSLVGTIYSKPFTVNETTSVKAVGYVIDVTTQKVTYGLVATKEILFGEKTNNGAATVTGGADNGEYEFLLATTGNSNAIHYFDTSAKKFNYEYGGTTYENTYYQISFTWKGENKGNWYLYATNGAVIKDSDNSTAYIARGTYTGPCFNDHHGAITKGTLVLTTAKGNQWNTATVEDSSVENRPFKLTLTVTPEKITTAANDAK
ncbi:MAG: chitobiase/beta-hexosaminidase C-terminal domain-containing protein [Treponema sp.]|nr:chitobiase/beta-hexosaminidase C-terminal domain-containing protein [Candidatus Treponema equifaecale]